MASAPVSPMMMRAGLAFHHRKPAHAPGIAAAHDGEVERVVEVVDVLGRDVWRNPQKPMTM